jgi:CRAL/TRIO domain protein
MFENVIENSIRRKIETAERCNTMRITIELETSDGMVSPFENKLVAYIAGELHSENTPVAETPSTEEEKPAPKRKRATRAKKKEEAPKEEAPKEEAPKEEAPKEEPKGLKDLLAHATVLASEMMQNEDVAVLKRILTTVGAKRVSTMTEEQAARFIELAKEANYA